MRHSEPDTQPAGNGHPDGNCLSVRVALVSGDTFNRMPDRVSKVEQHALSRFPGVPCHDACLDLDVTRDRPAHIEVHLSCGRSSRGAPSEQLRVQNCAVLDHLRHAVRKRPR